MPLKADDQPPLVPKFSFGSKSQVDLGGEESKFNQNKNNQNNNNKAKPRTKEDVNNNKDKKDDVKNDEDLPVLDEHGTTYNDVVRRIEEMDATKFKNSPEYELVNLSAVEIPESFISGGLADAEVYRDDKDQEVEVNFNEAKEVVLPDNETVKVNNVSAD